mgnify:FL=1
MRKIRDSNMVKQYKVRNIATIIISLFLILLATICLLQFQQVEKEKIEKQKLNGLRIFFPESEISALLYDGKHIWVGGRDGVYLIDPQSGKIIKEIAKDIQMTYTAGICQLDDNSVWIGHENSVTIFNDNHRIDFTSPQIPSGRVNIVVRDGSAGVWAGTQTGAVHFFKKNGNYVIDKILTSKDGLKEDAVNTIALRENHSIWFGAYLANKIGGLSILKDGQWQYFSVQQGLPHRYITATIPISDEYMLVGLGHLDRGGMALFRCDGDQTALETVYSIDDGLPGEKIRQLYLDSKEHLWITSESDGLLICPSYKALHKLPLEGKYLTTRDGLSDDEIKTIIEAEGYYWLGGRYGLTRIEAATIEEFFADLK